jgi:hypothetical protein
MRLTVTDTGAQFNTPPRHILHLSCSGRPEIEESRSWTRSLRRRAFNECRLPRLMGLEHAAQCKLVALKGRPRAGLEFRTLIQLGIAGLARLAKSPRRG